MRHMYLMGNWKMHKTAIQARTDFLGVVEQVRGLPAGVRVSIAPPSVFLSELACKTGNQVAVYAQNAHWATEGAFTGEISAGMLKSLHVAGSLVGHSERRQAYGESDATAGQRLGALVRQGLRCVLCVGESAAERAQGRDKEVLGRQLRVALQAAGVLPYQLVGADPQWPLLSLAYEPVWAIGTGQAATAKDAQATHGFLRQQLEDIYGSRFAQLIPILYGGSVTPQNVADFVSCPDIDGVLVGGASLKPDSFGTLCQKAAATLV